NKEFIFKIIDSLNEQSFRSVDLIVPESLYQTYEFKTILENYPKILSVLVHSVTLDFTETTRVKFTKNKIDDCSSCGVVLPKYFPPTIKHISESLKFNSCLNRKISVDVNGEIR
ncbi:MAG: hypothetical protein WD512_15600, partial [Candidatus Paceibacterota bacterium]